MKEDAVPQENSTPGAPEPFKGLSDEVESLLGPSVSSTIARENELDVREEVRVDIPESKVLLTPVTRSRVRLLLVTDEDVCLEGSVAQRTIADYGALFDELHVITRTKGAYTFKVLQISQNVWAYPTNTKTWWRFPLDAYRIAKNQLFFAGTFRADVVASSDPFELGLTAWWIAKKFHRGLHVTVSNDPDDPTFLDEDQWNPYRQLISRFVLPRATRVRALSEALVRALIARHSELEHRIDMLPNYFDARSLVDAVPAFDLKKRYSQFTFIMLICGHFEQSARACFAIDAASHALRQYTTVGLVVAGAGPAMERIAHHVREKGLSRKVMIEHFSENDLPAYLKTASMLISTETGDQNDHILSAAALLGAPVLALEGGMASTLYKDGSSGLMCKQNDIGCMIKAITRYMGDASFRKFAAEHAKVHAEETLGDPQTYRTRYQESIEATLLSEPDTVPENSPETVPTPTQEEVTKQGGILDDVVREA